MSTSKEEVKNLLRDNTIIITEKEISEPIPVNTTYTARAEYKIEMKFVMYGTKEMIDEAHKKLDSVDSGYYKLTPTKSEDLTIVKNGKHIYYKEVL